MRQTHGNALAEGRHCCLQPTRSARERALADPAITIRIPQDLLDQVDAWSEGNEPNRSDTIRRLIELGLKARPPNRSGTPQTRLSDRASVGSDGGRSAAPTKNVSFPQ